MIEIVFPRRLEELRRRLPLADLKAHAVTFKLEHFSLYEYRARLLIVEPDQEFWNILAGYEDQLGPYKICHVEVTCDFLYETEDEAAQAAEFFRQHLRKKYHRRGEIRVVGSTTYWEDRKARTNLKAYPRADKRTAEPLVRIEWIFKHAAHICERTGIATIGDFSDFDFDSFIAKHFLLEEINPVQVGRWINNIPRGAEVTVSPSGFTYNDAARAGHLLCRLNDIDSAAKLRQHIKEEKEKIRAKRGRRTEGEKKYASLTRYKLNSFFVLVKPDKNPY